MSAAVPVVLFAACIVLALAGLVAVFRRRLGVAVSLAVVSAACLVAAEHAAGVVVQ